MTSADDAVDVWHIRCQTTSADDAVDVWHIICSYLSGKDVMAVRGCNRTLYTNIPMNVRLKPHQKEHCQRLIDLVGRWHSYMDTSQKGSGKTFHQMWLAKECGLTLMVICQVNMMDPWAQLCSVYQVPLLDVISYQSLRGTSTSTLKHPWLERDGNKFTVTDEFDDYVQQGILLIFDEVQNLRNATAQFDAAYALASHIFDSESSSRVGLVSALPCNTDESVENMMKLLNLIREPKLVEYNRPTRTWEAKGLEEAYAVAFEHDPELANEIYKFRGESKKYAYQICYELYSEILVRHYSSATPAPTMEKNIEKFVCNAFYPVSDDELDDLQILMEKLAEVTNFNEETGETEYSKNTIGLLWKILPAIEKKKTQVFIRAAKEVLETNPTSKVVIFLNYLESIKLVATGLRKYDPYVITGSVPPSTRTKFIKIFQQENLFSRVIVTSPQVSGSGISLDDIYGNFPRYAFISPSYNFINLDQATGRIWRTNTKSDVHINLVFIQMLEQELAILQSLASKSDKARGMLYDPENVVFPGEYEIVNM